MKRKKVLAIALTLLIFIFTAVPVSTEQFKANASEAYQQVNSSYGNVTEEGVNLRTGPGKTFNIICKLKKDQKVTVIGKLGSWYAVYVNSSGNVGAISSYYVKIEKNKATVKGTKTTKSTKTTSTQNNSQINSETATATAKTAAKAVAAATVKDISSDEQALLDLANKAREKEGLQPLEFNADLVKVARLKANDMKNNCYFSHTSKFYGSPFDMMKKYNIKFSVAGENIAGNQSMEKAIKAWTAESGNNLFNKKFTHTGIGIVDSPTYGKIFVQMFIKK